MDWQDHLNDVVERFNEKSRGIMKVSCWLSFKRRKELVESSLVSILRYGIELTSGGSKKITERLERLQSQAARLVLQRGRRQWSRSEGLKTLGWLTIPQMAVEASMRTFLKILQTKRPQSIYEWITDQNGEIRTMSSAEVKRMTIIRRKSWLIRCLRWAKWLPTDLKKGDITKEGKKRRLKKWVRKIIPPQGDKVYHGKILPDLVMEKGRQTEEEFENPDTWLRGELEQISQYTEILHLGEMEM